MRIFIILALTTLPVFAAKKSGHSVSSPMTRDHELKTREYMIEISRQMGVTCNYCHDVKNFRDISMVTWKTSREHMRIVDLLNKSGFTKGPKADCYLCHRGKAVPDYKELPSTSEAKPAHAPSMEPKTESGH